MKKSKLYTILTLLGATCVGVSGFNSIKDTSIDNEVENLTIEPKLDIVEPESTIDENTYKIDNYMDTLEHTFNIEKARPIIKAFIDIDRTTPYWEVEKTLKAIGKIEISDIYTTGKSKYETWDMMATSNLESIKITFKENRVISKEYIKNVKDNNSDKVFVNYDSKLYKTEYSSGIYLNNKIKFKNEDVWNIEEKIYTFFN